MSIIHPVLNGLASIFHSRIGKPRIKIRDKRPFAAFQVAKPLTDQRCAGIDIVPAANYHAVPMGRFPVNIRIIGCAAIVNVYLIAHGIKPLRLNKILLRYDIAIFSIPKRCHCFRAAYACLKSHVSADCHSIYFGVRQFRKIGMRAQAIARHKEVTQNIGSIRRRIVRAEINRVNVKSPAYECAIVQELRQLIVLPIEECFIPMGNYIIRRGRVLNGGNGFLRRHIALFPQCPYVYVAELSMNQPLDWPKRSEGSTNESMQNDVSSLAVSFQSCAGSPVYAYAVTEFPE